MKYKYTFGQAMEMSAVDMLAAVKAREIPPRWVVGTGYKDARKVAIEYLEDRIADERKKEVA